MKILTFFAVVCFMIPVICGCSTDNNQKDNSDGGFVQTENIDSSENTTSSEQDGTENTSDRTDISEVSTMYITVNSYKLEVELAKNSSVTALVEILQQGKITYTATDYGNFEKVGDIGYTLPQNNERITTEAGDVILYLGSNICLYYGTNTWSFTRIGRINGYSEEELKTILCAGSGNVEITISLN